MLGLVREVLTHRCIEANIVCALTGNQLLGRAHLELLVQGGDFSRLNRPGFDGGSLVWITQATSG
jgi:hypothetical protein